MSSKVETAAEEKKGDDVINMTKIAPVSELIASENQSGTTETSPPSTAQDEKVKLGTTAEASDTNTTTTTPPPPPIKMYGTETALDELARQEFETQRALTSVDRAIQMQRSLSSTYG